MFLKVPQLMSGAPAAGVRSAEFYTLEKSVLCTQLKTMVVHRAAFETRNSL